MLLSELAVNLTAHLNTNKAKWTTSNITVKTELDPYLCILPELGVYIVPGFIQYNVSASGTRPRRVVGQTNNTLFCNLIVSKVFTELPTGDGVANWSEAYPIVDLRERAERYLMKYTFPGITLASVEPQPIEEAELDNRNFIAMTTFGFEQTECVSEHELP